jgi:hypothetical protein
VRNFVECGCYNKNQNTVLRSPGCCEVCHKTGVKPSIRIGLFKESSLKQVCEISGKCEARQKYIRMTKHKELGLCNRLVIFNK